MRLFIPAGTGTYAQLALLGLGRQGSGLAFA
jgi:hypothetical protein